MTTAVAPSSAALTAADRCDRCGAQAYLRVELQSGGELLFCAHHARAFGLTDPPTLTAHVTPQSEPLSSE